MYSQISEEQKINNLIAHIENMKDVKFIRNGSEYTPFKAARHLRMKREKVGNKIKTAIDFIDKVATKSYLSGDEYMIKFKDGTIISTKEVLITQLKKL